MCVWQTYFFPSLANCFFRARNIPYCIRPESKARCMRSRVTISRAILYQAFGFDSTGQGSYTPTQIECRQLGKVSSVQSAVSILSSWLVAIIILAYSGIEMKYGWLHSSYKNCNFFFSFSVNSGGSGL